MKRAHGPQHRDSLTDMYKLGRIRFHQGRFKEAEQLFSAVMEGETRTLGEDHPETLVTMDNLAMAHWNQDHHEQVLDLQSKLLDRSIEIIGPENPDTLSRLDTLRQILSELQFSTERVEEVIRPYLERMNLEQHQPEMIAQPAHVPHEDSTEVATHEKCSGQKCHYCCEPGLDDVD